MMKPFHDAMFVQINQNFDLVHDFFRATVDIADLVGIYLVMQRVSGRVSSRSSLFFFREISCFL